MIFWNSPEEYLKPNQLFVLLTAALEESKFISTCLIALSSCTDLNPLPPLRERFIRLVNHIWDPITKSSSRFNSCILWLLRLQEANDFEYLDNVIKCITQNMEKVVKGCRIVVEETHALAAVWQAEAVSLAAKPHTPNSPKSRTIDLIRDLIQSIARLSLAIGEIEIYWAKRLFWARQFGGPFSATLEQVAVVAPDWDRFNTWSFARRIDFCRVTVQISKIEVPSV